MKNGLLFFVLICLVSCGNIIDKPKKLIDKKTMAEMIAEIAIADQMNVITSDYHPEDETKYIFQHHKVKFEDFKESYTYYISNNDIDPIYDQAQKIVLEKDPKAKIYIEKKIKEQEALPKVELPEE